MNKCGICNKYHWDGDKHKCSPKWTFEDLGGGNTGQLYAFDFEDAAEEAMETVYFQEGGDIKEARIEITDENGNTKIFKCSAEETINYDVEEEV